MVIHLILLAANKVEVMLEGLVDIFGLLGRIEEDRHITG